MPLYFVQEGRRTSSTILDNVSDFHLVFAVVGPVRFDRIPSFVLDGHCLRKFGYLRARDTHRGMLPQPHDVPLALVLFVLTVTVLVLLAEEPTEVCEPLVVLETLTSPNSTGVVGMSLLVSIRRKIYFAVQNPMRAV